MQSSSGQLKELYIAINFTSNDHYTNMLIFIIASATIFQSFNVVDFYFQSKVLSKYVVYANILTLSISTIIKITLLLNEAPLIAFAWVVLFDSFVLAKYGIGFDGLLHSYDCEHILEEEMENAFIDKIRQIILDHLDDEKFGVSQLASEIGWSRSHTFKKVKSVTGISANQFIKETRLQEAVKLILNSNLTASEISYKVGFSSPSYFNKCFSKYYGITPGEYKEKPIQKSFDQQVSPSGVKKFQFALYFFGLIFNKISNIPVNSTATLKPTAI